MHKQLERIEAKLDYLIKINRRRYSWLGYTPSDIKAGRGPVLPIPPESLEEITKNLEK
jgi:hypothetical protein